MERKDMPVVHVFAKVVPDVAALEHDPVTLSPRLDTAPRKIGEADQVALEAGVRVKEMFGGEVVLLSAGYELSEALLREALAMGADKCFYVNDASLASADTWVTANVLAALSARAGPAQLYLCGEASSDYSNYQIGPRLAERLGFPCITHVTQLELSGDTVRAVRTLEDRVQRVEVEMPVILSVGLELAQPRLPSLLMIRAASRKPLTRVGLGELGLSADELTPRLSRISLKVAKSARRNVTLTGDPRECAAALIDHLVREGVLQAR